MKAEALLGKTEDELRDLLLEGKKGAAESAVSKGFWAA